MQPRQAATVAIRCRIVAVHETDEGIVVAVYDACDIKKPIDTMEVKWEETPPERNGP